jgi:hypothetical protein
MRQRTEAVAAVGVLLALSIAAGVIGHASAGPGFDTNTNPSTYLADPGGTRALFDALLRIGVDARRFRGRPAQLSHLADSTHQAFALLAPDAPLTSPEARAVLQFGRSADLVLAGTSTSTLMRCFGYRVEEHLLDAVAVTGTGTPALGVHAVLLATHDSAYTDSSRVFDVARLTCKVPLHVHPITLLGSSHGAVAVRIDSAIGTHAVILVADVGLFRNRTLRDNDAGVFALELLAPYRRVIFDEYHHGYGPSGSLAAATLAWSRQSPWGWMVWQLAAVGLLALLFGAVRFGPAVAVIVRRRRSPLEHVDALATALSAARGHDQAIAAMVRGLRRRLAPPLLRSGGDWREWLRRLDHRTVTPAQRDALDTLLQLTTPGQPASSVLRSAHTVEDIWQNLHH